MKRILLFTCILIVTANAFARELIHAYYGDYREIVRLVFVFPTPVQYSTLQDTDNRGFYIHIDNARQADYLLAMDFSSCALIDNVQYLPSGNGLRININVNAVYYAETFNLRERNTIPLSEMNPRARMPQGNMIFKIVVDIFRHREPWDLQSTRDYIHFYETVGYTDRANALRHRLNSGSYTSTPAPVYTPPVVPPPPPPQPVYTPPPQQPVATPQVEVTSVNPLLYLKPDVTYASEAHRSWINEAFMLYDLFKTLHNVIAEAERVLQLYDSQRTVDITFIETMSKSYNSLSSVNITINELRLQFQNLLQRQNFTSSAQTEYTRAMINHLLNVLNTYQQRANNLQGEYNRRINR